MIAGHANPDVLKAVHEAADKGLSFGAPAPAEVAMADRLCELIDGMDMVRMVNSGTEATMSAIRVARAATGRNRVLKFEGCYHGHADAFLVKAGSGALGDIGSHSIDLARFLVGEIREVSGLLETFVKERPLPEGGGVGVVDVDDAALALVRFEGGAIGTIEGTRFAPGRKNHNRFEINGSAGSLAFDLERMNELEVYREEGPDSGFRTVLATDPSHPFVEAWWPPGHILGYEHTFTHTVVDLLRAVEADVLPLPNFEDGVRNQRILDAIERSSASKQWEAV